MNVEFPVILQDSSASAEYREEFRSRLGRLMTPEVWLWRYRGSRNWDARAVGQHRCAISYAYIKFKQRKRERERTYLAKKAAAALACAGVPGTPLTLYEYLVSWYIWYALGGFGCDDDDDDDLW